MDPKNKIRFDFRDNLELANAFKDLNEGDSFKIVVEGKVFSKTTDEMVAGIEGVEVDGDEEKEVEPTNEQPVSIVMSKMAGGKMMMEEKE